MGISSVFACDAISGLDRDGLTDARWALMEPHRLGKPADPGRSGRNNRPVVEAVLWIARTGRPWRDPPERFGHRSTAVRHCRDWRAADVVERIVDAPSDEPDFESTMVDATIVKVHGHGQGAKERAQARATPRQHRRATSDRGDGL